MYEYISNVCNFLNNTQGYICDYQVKFLIEYINKNEYTDKELFDNVSIKDIDALSADVENDRQSDFYEHLYFLSRKFI